MKCKIAKFKIAIFLFKNSIIYIDIVSLRVYYYADSMSVGDVEDGKTTY